MITSKKYICYRCKDKDEWKLRIHELTKIGYKKYADALDSRFEKYGTAILIIKIMTKIIDWTLDFSEDGYEETNWWSEVLKDLDVELQLKINKCICKTEILVNMGCSCGQFQRELEMENVYVRG